MKYISQQQRWAVEQRNKERILKLNPSIDNGSGIYFLTREENGIKYGYVGKAVKLLNRMLTHLTGYQHIDLSIRKHGLYDSEKNPYGWEINFIHYPEDMLDEMEQYWIKKYANAGYQLRNKETGGTTGKTSMDNRKSPKGYRDGLAQGRKNLARELLGIIEKHLQISLKPEKQGNKVSEKQMEKFWRLLKEDNDV